MRSIPGSEARDALGPYPLFAAPRPAALAADVAPLRGELVSLTLVLDPFAERPEAELRAAFEHVQRFKEHVIVDLTRPLERSATKHHRYEARRALRAVTIEQAADPTAHLDEWHALYGCLVQRHGLRGLKAFSRSSFAAQLALPGARLLLARVDGEAVAAQLWLVDGDRAWSHLQAADARGYEHAAAYALYWAGLERLRDEGVLVADLGAGGGLTPGAGDGLARFKRGWSPRRLPAYLCGAVLDRAAYDRLAARAPATGYFPAYRAGELA